LHIGLLINNEAIAAEAQGIKGLSTVDVEKARSYQHFRLVSANSTLFVDTTA
jgi:hypothetical protein